MMTTIMARMSRATRRFRGDRRASSAVEFAMLLPLMMGLYLGGVEISQGIGIDRKVTLTAGALANLTAQSTTLSTSDMSNLMDASTAIMQPYGTTNLKMTVTCIKIDANKNATVKWSYTRGGTADSGAMTIPSALAVANSQLVLATVSYGYKPTVGYTITGTLTLSDQMYMSPRVTAPTYNGTACT